MLPRLRSQTMTMKSDNEDTNEMDKFEVVKEQTKELFEHDASLQTITKGAADVNEAQILLVAAEEYLSNIHLC